MTVFLITLTMVGIAMLGVNTYYSRRPACVHTPGPTIVSAPAVRHVAEEVELPAVEVPETMFVPSAAKPDPINSVSAGGDDHARIIARTLERYDAPTDVELAGSGPTVARYVLTPKGATKVSKIRGLADELSVAVGTPVRVAMEDATLVAETVHSERGVAGVDWPDSDDLTVSFGVDAVGVPLHVDLAKLPHMLVAGTTGSGKSVFLNLVLCGLLAKSPDTVRLNLIDPKWVELDVYRNAAHVDNVVNEPADAINLLADLCDIMDERYRHMRALGVRDFQSYRRETGAPYQVIVVDEYADLIMQDKSVEKLVARLGQKGRAAGVHLILATQKPSADVVTSVVKANLPSRVCFHVGSHTDSGVALDQSGAERLAGAGDGLLSVCGRVSRFQAGFLDDERVAAIVDSTWG